MHSGSLSLTLLVVCIVSCGGGTYFAINDVELTDPAFDATGEGFTDSGEHYDDCEDYCRGRLGVVTLDSCVGPTRLNADGEPVDGGDLADAAASPEGWYMVCTGTWPASGCDAAYADW